MSVVHLSSCAPDEAVLPKPGAVQEQEEVGSRTEAATEEMCN